MPLVFNKVSNVRKVDIGNGAIIDIAIGTKRSGKPVVSTEAPGTITTWNDYFESIITGWSGVVDVKGVDVPFSVENRAALVSVLLEQDKIMIILFNAIGELAQGLLRTLIPHSSLDGPQKNVKAARVVKVPKRVKQ